MNGLSFNWMSAMGVLMMFMNLSDIAFLNINGADYRCIIKGISKSEAINLLHNYDLTEKVKHYET